MTQESYEPAAHYDRVTEAWALLLGPELHYGVFDDPANSLGTATARLTQLMTEHAQFAPGLKVLDVGCGSGTQACRLVAEQSVDVLGITTSEVGVATSTAKAVALGLPGATFEVRDGTNNGLPDDSFDRVWVLESSHLMPDRVALVRECARVLRPGGRLVWCDLVRKREIPFAELRERREEFAVLRAAFGAARMDPVSVYTDAAESHGLRVDTVLDLTAPTYPTFDRWRRNLHDHRAAVEDLIGEHGADQFGRSLDVLEGLWNEGTLGYALMAASAPAVD